jgi:hypothetical protein
MSDSDEVPQLLQVENVNSDEDEIELGNVPAGVLVLQKPADLTPLDIGNMLDYNETTSCSLL